MVSCRNSPSWIAAEWGAPDRVKAGVTTRIGGYSYSPHNTLNLATHVGDDAGAVTRNRQHISAVLALPSEPVWLDQVHEDLIICAASTDNKTADGIYTDQAGVVCVIMTADCVPVLLCNGEGTRVAAIHIGWRGFCAGILDNAMKLFEDKQSGLHVWIGPHISSSNYEVGNDVRDACLGKHRELERAFTPNARGRWQADLGWMIHHQLFLHGTRHITDANWCTFMESELFYSYRRDGQTGRMASMIWIDPAT